MAEVKVGQVWVREADGEVRRRRVERADGTFAWLRTIERSLDGTAWPLTRVRIRPGGLPAHKLVKEATDEPA